MAPDHRGTGTPGSACRAWVSGAFIAKSAICLPSNVIPHRNGRISDESPLVVTSGKALREVI
jgi:hypothetical protein